MCSADTDTQFFTISGDPHHSPRSRNSESEICWGYYKRDKGESFTNLLYEQLCILQLFKWKKSYKILEESDIGYTCLPFSKIDSLLIYLRYKHLKMLQIVQTFKIV